MEDSLKRAEDSVVHRVAIRCKERNKKDFNHESLGEVEKKTRVILDSLKFEDLKIAVVPFISSKGFHDRSVLFKIINEKGESSRHIFDFSGGIDYVMDDTQTTKIYYFEE